MPPRSKRWSQITVATFFALLWLPLGIAIVQPDTMLSASEKRALSELPGRPRDAASLAALPAALDRYFDDHVGLRSDLIRAWAWLHIELLGVSPSKSLIVGRDGWFFFGDDDAVAQARGLARLSTAELREWARQLELRRSWLQERGAAYLVVFVPNKHRIYAEHLPDSVPRTSEGSTLDQLAEYLSKNSDVAVLDLRVELAQAKTHLRAYHKTDTHWNDHGAYAGYAAILRGASELLREQAPLRPVPVRRVDRTTPGLGLPRIVGLSRAYPELSHDLVVANPRASVPPHRRAAHRERAERQLPFALGTGDPQQPTAVMFRDSFANALVPYLSESFSRIVYIWSRDVDRRAVEVERPSLVIHEIAERFLGPPPREFGGR